MRDLSTFRAKSILELGCPFESLEAQTALLALVLVLSTTYLGLGLGGMERMVAYPLLLWEVGFGSHIIRYPMHAGS